MEPKAVRITFPYPEVASVEIPRGNFMGLFEFAALPHGRPEGEVVGEALGAPIGCGPLPEMVRGKERVLIVSDDHHRPTPVRRFLPCILEALHAGGVRDEQIEFMMALGSHRPMTRAEMGRKLGDDIPGRFRVGNNEWDNPDSLYSAGRVEPGIEVWVSRKMREADFVLGLGRIMPIEVCGFTGGGKIIVPGMCGEKTNSDMHWIRVGIPQEEIIGRRDNPIREAIDRSAMAAGLSAIFNVILDGGGTIVEAVFGHPVEAHRRGAAIAAKVHGVAFPGRPDIVIADGYPFDVEFWQVNKALDTAGMVVREGGIVILVSPCYEGISRTHAEKIIEFGYRTKKEVRQLVARGEITHLVTAVHMMQVAEATIEKGVRCILVTDGISRETVEKVGLDYAADAQSALAEAFRRVGREASVAVLRGAAEMLPVMGKGGNG